MAHVLPQQQRSAPPYLLIGSILLFLISAVLAVVFYVKYDKQTKALADASDQTSKATKDSRDAKNNVEKLVQQMTGRSDKTITAQTALNEAQDALNNANAKPFVDAGLIGAVRGLSDSIDANAKTIDDLKAQDSNLTGQLQTMQAEREKVGTMRQEDSAKAAQEVETAKADVQADWSTRTGRLEQAIKEKDANISEKEKQITELAADNEKRTRDVQTKDARIEELTNTIREFKGSKAKPGEQLMRQPDGRIIKVLPDQGLVYIDLGEQDHITPGMPFSVYSNQTGIPEDGKSKAKIVVKNVSAATSECRIVETSKDDPLIEGDQVANIVYSPTRTYSFVVEGNFDVYADGQATPAGNRMVRSMIERMGGKIVDKVNVDTDFVVLGEEPVAPPKPGNDAPQSDWQIYKDRLVDVEKYNAVKTGAASLQIPVLNISRFLAFTGSVPKKSLTEQLR